MKGINPFALTAANAAQATAPGAGKYAANVYVSWVTGTGCLDTAGADYPAIMSYAGLSGPHIGLRVPMLGGIVSILSFTVTDGSGTTSLSGDFSWKTRGSVTNDENGTYSAKITEIDKYSFVFAVQERYGASCLERQIISLTQT